MSLPLPANKYVIVFVAIKWIKVILLTDNGKKYQSTSINVDAVVKLNCQFFIGHKYINEKYLKLIPCLTLRPDKCVRLFRRIKTPAPHANQINH